MPPAQILIPAVVLCAAVLFLLFRRKPGPRAPRSASGGTAAPAASAPAVDPRERRIEDSAQVVRAVLGGILASVRETDSAASASTAALNASRIRINNIKASGAAEETGVLLDEIDRVIDSNSSLKQELSAARERLANQEREIASLRTAVREDALTQLGNRAAFDDRLKEAHERLRRYGEGFVLLLMDIDHFKQVNDTHGHPAGDRVLKGLALKLKATLRSSDFIARYGGEEFGVLLYRSDPPRAREVAEKLREAVEKLSLTLDDTTLRITISIGMAEARPDEAPEALVQRADEALYRAKRQGRNRVVLDTDPVPEAAAPPV